ncbi:MAG: hypothetical protein AAF488_07790 [Planctomycetota bacterium]
MLMTRPFVTLVLVLSAGVWLSEPALAQLPEQSDAETLFADDGANLDRFGIALAIDGDVAVVGAFADDDGAVGAGSAYVFRRIGGVWLQEQKLTAFDGGFDDQFGFYVAVHGDVIAVTARNVPAVYMFRYDGATWVQEQKLNNSGSAYGSALAVYEDVLVVGDFLHDFTQGGAYVYEFSGTSWSQTQLLSPSGALLFGISLDLEGDTLVIGASAENQGIGAAYVYARNGGTFNLQQVLAASDPSTFTGFGASVALDGSALCVAAVGANDDAGALYVFRNDGVTWTEQQKISLATPPPAGGLGLVLDLCEPHLVAGSYGGIGCDEATQSYIFTEVGGTWVESRELVAPSTESANSMSRALAIDGEEVWVGASCIGPGSPGPGGVYIYDLNPSFIRGDCNQDELVDISDAIEALSRLFVIADAVVCEDACDFNDDGQFDVADPVATILFLFFGSVPIPAPGSICGGDPTTDALFCRSLPTCP